MAAGIERDCWEGGAIQTRVRERQEQEASRFSCEHSARSSSSGGGKTGQAQRSSRYERRLQADPNAGQAKQQLEALQEAVAGAGAGAKRRPADGDRTAEQTGWWRSPIARRAVGRGRDSTHCSFQVPQVRAQRRAQP